MLILTFRALLLYMRPAPCWAPSNKSQRLRNLNSVTQMRVSGYRDCAFLRERTDLREKNFSKGAENALQCVESSERKYSPHAHPLVLLKNTHFLNKHMKESSIQPAELSRS